MDRLGPLYKLLLYLHHQCEKQADHSNTSDNIHTEVKKKPQISQKTIKKINFIINPHCITAYYVSCLSACLASLNKQTL